MKNFLIPALCAAAALTFTGCINDFNEDDFVESSGEMKELTVTITLCEYRNLIAENARYEALINQLGDKRKNLESQVKTLSEMVLYDHPEFYTDMFDAVVKFLKKANTPVSVEEESKNEEANS